MMGGLLYQGGEEIGAADAWDHGSYTDVGMGEGGQAHHPYHISGEYGLSCWSAVVFGFSSVTTSLPSATGG